MPDGDCSYTNTTMPDSAKSALRREFRAKRNALTAPERAAGSAQVCSRLPQVCPLFSAASGAIAVYLAGEMEVDLGSFICSQLDRGAVLVAPRAAGFARITDLESIAYTARGLAEPIGTAINTSDIELFLIPGLAFDRYGSRLGQGGGWYDKALLRRRPEALLVGIAFDEQIADCLPREEHDVPMDCVLTPTRWLDLRSK